MATKKTAKTAAKAKTTTKKAVSGSAAHPRVVETVLPDEYRPISMWGYFGFQILFALPLVGWIICIGLAFMAKNHNTRNFARSQFCWLIIYIIVFCVLAGVGALTTVLDAFGVI